MKTILSLFDHSGAWPQPYRDAGYQVIQVDLKHKLDVLDLKVQDGRLWGQKIHGILAAPPCTHFSGSGAQYWKAKDADGRTAEALKLVDATMELVEMLEPAWWVLENPAGRLNTLRPQMAAHGPRYFDPCDYAGHLVEHPSWNHMMRARHLVAGGHELSKGDVQAVIDTNAYTKRTGLWGSFRMPAKIAVDPVRCSSQGSWTQLLGGKSERTKELRSITPAGFAQAFFQSNP